MLMSQKKIMFVYLPDYLSINNEQTPYGLFCLKEILDLDDRYEAVVLDYNRILFERGITNTTERMGEVVHAVATEISEARADVVSFYTMCSNYYFCIPVAREMKRQANSTVCILAGPHASCISQSILEKYSFIDYVAIGEGEKSILPILGALFEHDGLPSFDGVSGIAYRKDGEVIKQWDRKARLSGDEIPRFDLGKYVAIDPKTFLTLEGGRGCPFTCTFCSTQRFWGNVFVVKPIEKIISEIEYYHYKYGSTKFSITHDLFTANKKYIMDFCHALNELPFRIKWSCSSRLDVIDSETISAMICSGCSDIYIGVESGSDKIQSRINKRLDLAALVPVLTQLLEGGVSCIVSFIYGFPFETEEDREETLQKIYSIKQLERSIANGKLTVQCHRLTFLPGTAIAEEHFEQLEYEGINTMSFFDEEIVAPSDIKDLALYDKEGFLNFYNLRERMNPFENHIGDFICLVFALLYDCYPDIIDSLICKTGSVTSFVRWVYSVNRDFFLESVKFFNTFFGKERDSLLCSAFEEFVDDFSMNETAANGGRRF